MQWLSSEREKKSIVPPVFWYFSISGAVVLLTYVIHKQDLVFTIGQSTGLFIYARNLQLIRTAKKRIVSTAHASETEFLQSSGAVSEQRAA